MEKLQLSKLQLQLNLSFKAVRAILYDWGFEGYQTIDAVIDDREELESYGYDIQAFANELGLTLEDQNQGTNRSPFCCLKGSVFVPEILYKYNRKNTNPTP